MKEYGLFRMAIALDYKSKETTIEYLAIFSLMAIDYFNNTYISIAEIKQYIKNEFSLLFTEEEITNAIDASAFNFEFNEDGKVRISEKDFANFRRALQNDRLESSIQRFIEQASIDAKLKQKIVQGIKDYIYNAFNMHSVYINAILNNKCAIDISLESENGKKFTEEENEVKVIVNEFLNWDNAEKNECVSEIVSLSIDYCRINGKLNTITLEMFRNINFVLDSNIIVRLLGINGTERKEAMQHFVDTCNRNSVNLHVTNYTKHELDVLINLQTRYIDSFVKSNSGPLEPDIVRCFLDDRIHFDFYKVYYYWYKTKKKKQNDLSGFEQYLKREIRKVYNCFRDINYTLFSDDVERDIDTLSKRLSLYKNVQGNFNEEMVETSKVDIKNIEVIIQERQKSKLDNYFMISADRRLIAWAHENFQGITSYVDLPSAWLAILLKVAGRTDDDYSAYCKFLSCVIHPKDRPIKQKDEITAYLSGIEGEDEIKEAILLEIQSNYTKYADMSSGAQIVASALKDYMELKEVEIESKVRMKLEKGLENQYKNDIKAAQNENRTVKHEIIKKQKIIDRIIKEKIQRKINIAKWKASIFWIVYLVVGFLAYLFIKEPFIYIVNNFRNLTKEAWIEIGGLFFVPTIAFSLLVWLIRMHKILYMKIDKNGLKTIEDEVMREFE